jgi:hypothetical protein
MNLQEKMIETTAEFRVRAAALASAAVETARDLDKVARRHGGRFIVENRAIALEAGKDLGLLFRSTFASFTNREANSRAPRKKTVARKARGKKAN